TVRLSLLWFLMFDLVIMMFVSDQPGSVVDFLRGFLLPATLVIWIALQTDRLARRNYIVSIFTDPEQQALARKKETLPQGMTKDEALYWWCVTFEVLIFAEAAANIAVELWWWLHGTSQAGWYRIGASLIAFVRCCRILEIRQSCKPRRRRSASGRHQGARDSGVAFETRVAAK